MRIKITSCSLLYNSKRELRGGPGILLETPEKPNEKIYLNQIVAFENTGVTSLKEQRLSHDLHRVNPEK